MLSIFYYNFLVVKKLIVARGCLFLPCRPARNRVISTFLALLYIKKPLLP
nr:MAG TPA: hypothetical protein [Caudoviricetes sp.]